MSGIILASMAADYVLTLEPRQGQWKPNQIVKKDQLTGNKPHRLVHAKRRLVSRCITRLELLTILHCEQDGPRCCRNSVLR